MVVDVLNQLGINYNLTENEEDLLELVKQGQERIQKDRDIDSKLGKTS